MIVYEVNVFVREAIWEAYRDWLESHIREIRALPGFTGVEVFECLEPAAPGEVPMCIHYRLRDRDALAVYLREHAPRLRADGVERFGDGFRAERRVLQRRGLLE